VIELKKLPPERLRDLWVNSGSIVLTPETTVYHQGTIFQVNYQLSGKYDTKSVWGAVLRCTSTYRVDDQKPNVDWKEIEFDDVGRLTTVQGGVEVYHFEPLLSYLQLQEVDAPVLGINVNEKFVPRDPTFKIDKTYEAKIVIPDDELVMILNEVGVPFLDIRELEYGRKDVVDICVFPCVQEYYKFFPIVKEDVLGALSVNQEFKVKYPEGAYHAIPYYTMGGGGGGIGAGGSAFAFMSEQFMSGAYGGNTGGRFGRGVRYYGKPVPGFVGMGSQNSRLQQMEVNQGYTNYFRREKYKKIKEPDGYYATGYSTVGGRLNIKFLCESRNWDDVEYVHLNELRNLCTAKVMQSLGMLRSLISVDVAKLDFSLYTNRAKELRDEVMTFWKSSSNSLAFAIQRGGG
jgi:hypothetical protein